MKWNEKKNATWSRFAVGFGVQPTMDGFCGAIVLHARSFSSCFHTGPALRQVWQLIQHRLSRLNALNSEKTWLYIYFRYGRWKVLVPTGALQMVFAVGCAFVQNYYIYIAMRFLIAFNTSGAYMAGFVLSKKMTTHTHYIQMRFISFLNSSQRWKWLPIGCGRTSVSVFSWCLLSESLLLPDGHTWSGIGPICNSVTDCTVPSCCSTGGKPIYFVILKFSNESSFKFRRMQKKSLISNSLIWFQCQNGLDAITNGRAIVSIRKETARPQVV